MKKTTQSKSRDSHGGKGFLELAGEAVAVLGEEIVEGKDKIVEVASEKFTAIKKAIKKITKKKPIKKMVKKKALPSRKSKKASPKKSAVKKSAKKSIHIKKRR